MILSYHVRFTFSALGTTLELKHQFCVHWTAHSTFRTVTFSPTLITTLLIDTLVL